MRRGNLKIFLSTRKSGEMSIEWKWKRKKEAKECNSILFPPIKRGFLAVVKWLSSVIFSLHRFNLLFFRLNFVGKWTDAGYSLSPFLFQISRDDFGFLFFISVRSTNWIIREHDQEEEQ